MVGYVKHFKNNNSKDTITMSCNVTNNKLLKKYTKKHYPQTFLKECKYEIKNNKKTENLIDDDFGPSSSDESDNEEFNGSDNEESND